MHKFFSSGPQPVLNSRHIPVLASALIVTEVFFKFGSFSLEFVAFLALSYALDAIYVAISNRLA